MPKMLKDDVSKILTDTDLDHEDDARDSSRAEELCALATQAGWPAIQAEMLSVLATSGQQDHWRVAASVLWAGALDGKLSDANRVIAHLCWRFPPGDNLAWSIISKLKHLDYLSTYDPLVDPEVVGELARLKQAN